jgi:hypothetical protein
MSDFAEWLNSQAPATLGDVVEIATGIAREQIADQARRIAREELLAFVVLLEAHPEVPHGVPYSQLVSAEYGLGGPSQR